MKPCEEYGHVWKCYRKDKICVDSGNTELILYFRCNVCDIKFDTVGSEDVAVDEKDYDDLRDSIKRDEK